MKTREEIEEQQCDHKCINLEFLWLSCTTQIKFNCHTFLGASFWGSM